MMVAILYIVSNNRMYIKEYIFFRFNKNQKAHGFSDETSRSSS